MVYCHNITTGTFGWIVFEWRRGKEGKRGEQVMENTKQKGSESVGLTPNRVPLSRICTGSQGKNAENTIQVTDPTGSESGITK